MKNFFLSIFITAALCGALQLFLPWWIIAVAAFAVGYFVKQKPLAAFFAGFVAVFLLWVGYACLLSSANDNLLAGKVAELLKALTQGKVVLLYVITGLIGGLVSGFAALTASFLHAD